MAKKDQVSIRLSPELWAQVDDLDGYFGNGRSEVIAFILRSWFSKNQPEITDTKAPCRPPVLISAPCGDS